MVKVPWVSKVIRRAGQCLVLPAGMTLGGCSFVFVDAPPAHPERLPAKAEIKCTTNRAAPIVDTVITVVQLLRTGLAANAQDADYVDYPISREVDLAAGITLATGFGVSAIYGHVSTSKCASLKAERSPEPAPMPPNAGGEPATTSVPPRSKEKPAPPGSSSAWGR